MWGIELALEISRNCIKNTQRFKNVFIAEHGLCIEDE